MTAAKKQGARTTTKKARPNPPVEGAFKLTLGTGQNAEHYWLDPDPDMRALDLMGKGHIMDGLEFAMLGQGEFERFRSTELKISIRDLGRQVIGDYMKVLGEGEVGN